MTWQNELHDILRSKTLIKRALQGAGIAFILIFIFIFISRKGKMDFETWELLAVASVTMGGAFGGVFYNLMDILRIHGGWKKVLANVAAVLVYIVTLYLSLVLSLNATGQWD